MSDLRRELHDAVTEAVDHNRALADGVRALLIGRTIAGAGAEVWDSDGRWSLTLTLAPLAGISAISSWRLARVYSSRVAPGCRGRAGPPSRGP